jgi:hypothetical protein
LKRAPATIPPSTLTRMPTGLYKIFKMIIYVSSG